MKLETKRLILRDYVKEDANAISKNISNLNISKWLLVVPYPYSKKDALDWINHNLKKQKEKKRLSYQFVITLKPSSEAIGGIGIEVKNEDRGIADIGYWLAEKYWRKGIVFEACNEIIDLSFKKLKVKKIMIPVFVENEASCGMAKKLGAKLEGTLRKQCISKATNQIHDENVYGLLKEEWRKNDSRN